MSQRPSRRYSESSRDWPRGRILYRMVGPWQIPVANAAVTCTGYEGYTGEAMAMGERPTLAMMNPAAAARMTIGEAIQKIN